MFFIKKWKVNYPTVNYSISPPYLLLISFSSPRLLESFSSDCQPSIDTPHRSPFTVTKKLTAATASEVQGFSDDKAGHTSKAGWEHVPWRRAWPHRGPGFIQGMILAYIPVISIRSSTDSYSCTTVCKYVDLSMCACLVN